MKTLDEVIEVLEDARVQVETGTGYWVDYRDNDELKNDALHYLKDMKNLEEDYDILYNKYWREFNQQQANPALTWDELCQMEGKPVWIEEYDAIDSTRGWRCCRWMLVEFVNDSYMDARNSDGEQYNFDKGEETWQAYRKERE